MKRWVALAALAAAWPAAAVEFRSVSEPAVLYDAPSAKAKQLYIIHRRTPVEVVVAIEGWAKVRDADGALAWIEKRALSDQRTLLVRIDRAQIRAEADEKAPLVFEAERHVVLDFLEPGPAGWAKVRHRDGQQGYVRLTQIWGG